MALKIADIPSQMRCEVFGSSVRVVLVFLWLKESSLHIWAPFNMYSLCCNASKLGQRILLSSVYFRLKSAAYVWNNVNAFKTLVGYMHKRRKQIACPFSKPDWISLFLHVISLLVFFRLTMSYQEISLS